MSKSKADPELAQERRKRAWDLHCQSASIHTIAQELGLSLDEANKIMREAAAAAVEAAEAALSDALEHAFTYFGWGKYRGLDEDFEETALTAEDWMSGKSGEWDWVLAEGIQWNWALDEGMSGTLEDTGDSAALDEWGMMATITKLAGEVTVARKAAKSYGEGVEALKAPLPEVDDQEDSV